MVIYKITNTTNGKVYIGQTRQDATTRIIQHKTNLKLNRHHNAHLQSAWNLYKEASFIFEVVDNASGLDELNELEKMWISKTNSLISSEGYNLTDGGQSCEFSKESRKVMSESQKKFFKTDRGIERLKELSQYRIGKAPWNKNTKGICKSWNKGKTFGKQSPELIAKRSLAMKGKNSGADNPMYGKLPHNAKSILCHQTKEVFKSASEAAKKLGLISRSIRRVANGVRSSIRGYTFEFINLENQNA